MSRPVRIGPRSCAALAVALLAGLGAAPAPAATSRSPAPVRRPPLVLPGSVHASSVERSPGSWIVGGRPGGATARIARRFDARSLLDGAAVYAVDVHRARAFAAALRAAGRLSFAEPDARARRDSFPSDPFTPRQWWLPAVVNQGLTPPPVTSHSPILAIADSQVARNHPDLKGHVATTSSRAVGDEHGTAVAGVASASANGTGIVGVWPGMRVLDSVNELKCSDLVRSVNEATKDGAAVINMSYGFAVNSCYAHEVATNYAFGKGVLPVAAGGNDFQQGNQPTSPAVDPHVMTVAAVDEQRNSAYFSSENDAIDISAPGVDVLTDVPRAFDSDGKVNGYESLDGTSFSSPIAAAAAAWIMQARPSLANDQVASVMRHSAQDLGPPGWDQEYGYGLLKLKRALKQVPEAHDPNEPNDDIAWVDGTIFKADPPIFGVSDKKRTLAARLDQFEDPADVYRVRVAAHAKLRFTLKPAYGDPDLEIYRGSATTIYSTKGRLATSTRTGSATDTITWTNGSSKPVWIYVDTYIGAGVRQLDSAYQLTVARL